MVVSSAYMRRMGIEKAIENLQPLIQAADDPAERGALLAQETELRERLDPRRAPRLGDIRFCAACGKEYTYETIGGYRCRDCRNAYYRERRQQMTPEEKRAAGHKSHGRPLSPEEFAAKVGAQGGGCAICGDMPPDKVAGRPRKDGTRSTTSGLEYDHDHETGAGRGLLCHSCNVMLGWARDLPERLEAAAAYLREWAAASEAHAPEAEKSSVDFCTTADLSLDEDAGRPWTVLRQTQMQIS
jgi:hypothetical protein